MSRQERPSGSDPASWGEPVRQRASSGFDASNGIESIRFGCSMLSKLRFQPRNRVSVPIMRCSLGYALHGNDEVAKCLAVEGPNECWKMAPSWRVNPPDRPERLTPDNPTERATPLPVHTAPHIVAIEESSDDAEAGPVSSSDIALADDELHQTDEFGDSNEATIDDASGHVHGANGFVELTIESEVIQITRRVATRIEPAPAASDEPTDTDQ